MLPVQVVADGKDITGLVETVTWANSDPGGFETASLDPRGGLLLRPGCPLIVRHGLTPAWHGRILDPGDHDKYGHSARQFGAVGFGHKLDDQSYSMPYVDRDLGRWTGPSRGRQVGQLLAGVTQISGPENAPDTNSGLPALLLRMTGAWTGQVNVEGWYDAGQGNLISSVYTDQAVQNASYAAAGFTEELKSAAADDSGSTTTEATLTVADAAYHQLAATQRYVLFKFANTAAGGTQGTDYLWMLRKLAVYGPHGLPRRGPDPGGFYPSDIALDALARSGAGFRPVITTADSYIVAHYAQYTPVGPSTFIGDMAKLMAWHWGVWEPGGAFDDRPTFIFAPPPADATAVIDRYKCDDFQAPRVDFDKLYNVCQVTYTDAAGTAGIVEVSLPDGRLDASGVTRRVLGPISMGAGSAGAAQAYGIFALRLAQRSARTGGSVTLKGDALLPAGGTVPACLLRSGRDRARLLGLNDGGDLFASDTRALDSFLVRRVESTATQDGSLSTRVDFDEGVDLMEVLNARLATAAVIAGA